MFGHDDPSDEQVAGAMLLYEAMCNLRVLVYQNLVHFQEGDRRRMASSMPLEQFLVGAQVETIDVGKRR